MDPSDYQKDPRAPHVTQLSTTLPGMSAFITTTDVESTKSKVLDKREGDWIHYDDKKMAFKPVFTFPFNADLNGEVDVTSSDELIAGGKLGLVRQGGTICRYVDFSPGYTCIMHRTQSLDFGILVHGTIEMLLDDGSTTLMRVGDVAVQRATMHAWRNPSEDTWARVLFILQDVQPLKLGDKHLEEDLGDGVDGLPPSKSDQ